MHKVNSRSTCFNEKPFFIFFVCGKWLVWRKDFTVYWLILLCLVKKLKMSSQPSPSLSSSHQFHYCFHAFYFYQASLIYSLQTHHFSTFQPFSAHNLNEPHLLFLPSSITKLLPIFESENQILENNWGWLVSLSLSLSLLVGRDSEREEKTYCRGKRRKRDLTLTCLERACFPENNSGKQAQEKKGNYYMAFPLTNLSFPLTHIFLCNHTEMFNPIFFSFQVLSLNSSLSKKIGADLSLSLSLSVGWESEREEKAYCRGKRRKRDLTLTSLERACFWKIIVENKPKKTWVIILWLFHWPTWVFLWPTFSYATIQKCFFLLKQMQH